MQQEKNSISYSPSCLEGYRGFDVVMEQRECRLLVLCPATPLGKTVFSCET
jgi:hypothetical protein